MDFTSLEYLQYGTERQQRAYTVLVEHEIMEKLAEFDPVLAGTIPLNIDVASSDLDIICCCGDYERFENVLNEKFSDASGFSLRQKTVGGYTTLIASFKLDGFPVEVFGQNRPVQEQEAYRHMVIEHQVLLERGEDFRDKVVALKNEGIKTERAFAQLLGLPCIDPYSELLEFTI